MDVFDALARARARGEVVVLVTVTSLEGDERSRPGAKVVADMEGRIVAGTLGCSEFDALAAEAAWSALESGAVCRSRREGREHGQAWTVELFAEVLRPQPAVLVLGATPVARALCDLLVMLGRRVELVAPGGDTAVAAGVRVKADDPARYLLAAAPGRQDAVVLSDHDAPWVDEALRVALASAAGYVGMLGSRRHAPEPVERLIASGVPRERFARLRSPVGLDIGATTPEEIALSIAADIVAVERGRTGGAMTMAWDRWERP